MKSLEIGNTTYLMSDTEAKDALAHACGVVFVEIQQLEFTIISYLAELSGNDDNYEFTFNLFASKTFGNLLKAMNKHDYLEPLATEMAAVKERRDFFVHKFLFGRYGGDLTTDEEYLELVREALELRDIFASARTSFHHFMFDNAPLQLLAIERDPETHEIKIVESEFSATAIE